MPFQIGDDVRHGREVERSGQIKNSGPIGDRRRRMKIIHPLAHAVDEPRPIGEPPQYHRGVHRIGRRDTRRQRRPRLTQRVKRAKRQRFGVRLAGIDVEFLQTAAYARAAAALEIEFFYCLRPKFELPGRRDAPSACRLRSPYPRKNHR